MQISRFRALVWKYFRAHGRHELPWRTFPKSLPRTARAYRILVSEIMLQQTQVDRVIPFYESWLARFPNVQALGEAPLSGVLKAWQGLGYNRRAKMLHLAAKELARRNAFPKTARELEMLPGVGPYTAHAVAAFAFNADGVFLETNIRTAVMHHFFPRKKKVNDAEIQKILATAFPKGRAREWYAALMDYGAHLKRSGVRINARSKTYTKQPPFRGSARQARGAILKALAASSRSRAYLAGILGPDREEQVLAQIEKLKKEGMIAFSRRKFHLPH